MNAQQAWLLIEQGTQHFNRGDFMRAIGCYEQAVAQAHADDDTAAEMNAFGWLSAAWYNLGENTKAIEAATRQLALARQVKDEQNEIEAARRLALALAGLDLRGRWREIRPLLLDGLATARRLGDHYEELEHLRRLGEFAVDMDEFDQGLARLQEALTAITPDLTKPHYFRNCIYGALSLLMRKRGNAAEAVRYAEMAIGEARQNGNPRFVAEAQYALARAERERGDRLEALRLVEESLEDARKQGWTADEQEGEWLRSELERELGHPEVAEGAARRALELARELRYKEEEVESLLSLGQALAALGRKDEAREALQQARRLSQERDYPDHFERAEQELVGLNG